MSPSHLKGLNIATSDGAIDYNENWTSAQLKKWIQYAGGKHQTKITDDTTHLVVSLRLWKRGSAIVKDALMRNERFEGPDEEGKAVHIVSWDWLADCLDKKSRKREGPYSFQKMEKVSLSRRKKMKRNSPLTIAGMMGEVFREETDRVFTQEERDAMTAEDSQCLQQRLDEAEDLKKERELLKRMYREEHRSVFRDGAIKARNEIMSNNYHIYDDSTGFTFRVVLTKVFVTRNINESMTLTIYESNHVPLCYAMNTLRRSIKHGKESNIVSAVGSSYETVWRCFTAIFKDKTGVDWDDRFEFAIQNFKHSPENKQRPQSFKYDDPRKKKNKTTSKMLVEDIDNLEEQQAEAWADERQKFDQAKFEYHPPSRGPVGRLPDEKQQFRTQWQCLASNKKPMDLLLGEGTVDEVDMRHSDQQEADNRVDTDNFLAHYSNNEDIGEFDPTVNYSAILPNQYSIPTARSVRQPVSRAGTVFDFDSLRPSDVPDHINDNSMGLIRDSAFLSAPLGHIQEGTGEYVMSGALPSMEESLPVGVAATDSKKRKMGPWIEEDGEDEKESSIIPDSMFEVPSTDAEYHVALPEDEVKRSESTIEGFLSGIEEAASIASADDADNLTGDVSGSEQVGNK